MKNTKQKPYIVNQNIEFVTQRSDWVYKHKKKNDKLYIIYIKQRCNEPMRKDQIGSQLGSAAMSRFQSKDFAVKWFQMMKGSCTWFVSVTGEQSLTSEVIGFRFIFFGCAALSFSIIEYVFIFFILMILIN